MTSNTVIHEKELTPIALGLHVSRVRIAKGAVQDLRMDAGNDTARGVGHRGERDATRRTVRQLATLIALAADQESRRASG
jgi:hypothetical protein